MGSSGERAIAGRVYRGKPARAWRFSRPDSGWGVASRLSGRRDRDAAAPLRPAPLARAIALAMRDGAAFPPGRQSVPARACLPRQARFRARQSGAVLSRFRASPCPVESSRTGGGNACVSLSRPARGGTVGAAGRFPHGKRTKARAGFVFGLRAQSAFLASRRAKAIAFATRRAFRNPAGTPKRSGQRPPRPRRALLARRVGRWPTLVSSRAVTGGNPLARAGETHAFPFSRPAMRNRPLQGIRAKGVMARITSPARTDRPSSGNQSSSSVLPG